MPLLTTSAILATRGEETIGTKIRIHWIQVYPKPVSNASGAGIFRREHFSNGVQELYSA